VESGFLQKAAFLNSCIDLAAPIIPCMRPWVTILLLFAVGAIGVAQDVTPSAAPAPLLVISKLPPPVYPAIARAARVTGDVNLTVMLRRDGTIDAVHAISGPPMLRDHAEELARQTQFECGNCSAEPTSLPLTVRYAMAPAASDHDPSYPRVAQLNGVIIIVTDQPVMISDPAIDRTRVRSWKCFYLWRCGWREE
jgi:Gram-negative bacterial TonB protein C-terminal